jgi:hypothetical protein
VRVHTLINSRIPIDGKGGGPLLATIEDHASSTVHRDVVQRGSNEEQGLRDSPSPVKFSCKYKISFSKRSKLFLYKSRDQTSATDSKINEKSQSNSNTQDELCR